ncbi:hypothetical protein AJ79_03419 [Helicocarpus griseus UAMH5409]|uniref:Uncharacterized protein n=1 Tax=Helicocarpus griseus UAMH5409 TaxID=1447875 RepID=A0A2B7XYJ6_9EURO|nr:hypothetical protein AJ79_03419 [Helicocarpus griseus UAMH5409]
MLTAIVTGATGITGSAIVRHLLEDPSITKIYTLSRSQPGEKDARVQHVHLDLQDSAEEMAKSLSGISAEYVYFCAYLAKPDEGEAARVNGALLSNFIRGIELTGAVKQLKRFILTCGFKHYGVHQGLPKQPLLETDPRLEGDMGNGAKWPPNFYYTQQDILKEAAVRGNWEWVCTLPNDVIGYAKQNFMNEATAIGLYCAVSKVLPGSQLIYPGNRLNYFIFNCWTSADLHARFCLWAATAPGAGNNIFNVINGDTQSFQTLWPRMAQRFGCKIPENMFDPATTKAYTAESTDTEMKTKNPISVHAKKLGIVNGLEVSRTPALHLPIDPQKWAQRADVKEAWGKLKTKYGLDQAAWDKATWDFLTFVLGREWGCVGTMDKARKLGWTGYEETWESFERTFEALEREGILPPVEQLKRDF